MKKMLSILLVLSVNQAFATKTLRTDGQHNRQCVMLCTCENGSQRSWLDSKACNQLTESDWRRNALRCKESCGGKLRISPEFKQGAAKFVKDN